MQSNSKANPTLKITYDTIQTALNNINIDAQTAVNAYKYLQSVYNQDPELKCLNDFELDTEEKTALKEKITHHLEIDYNDRISPLIRKAYKHVNKNKYKPAIKLYAELVTYRIIDKYDRDEFARTTYNLAHCYEMENDYNNALHYYQLTETTYQLLPDTPEDEVISLKEKIEQLKAILDSTDSFAATPVEINDSNHTKPSSRKRKRSSSKTKKDSDDEFNMNENPLDTEEVNESDKDDELESFNPNKQRKLTTNNNDTSKAIPSSDGLTNHPFPLTQFFQDKRAGTPNNQFSGDICLKSIKDTNLETALAHAKQCVSSAQNKDANTSYDFLRKAILKLQETCAFYCQQPSFDQNELNIINHRIAQLEKETDLSKSSSVHRNSEVIELISNCMELSCLYARKSNVQTYVFYINHTKGVLESILYQTLNAQNTANLKR